MRRALSRSLLLTTLLTTSLFSSAYAAGGDTPPFIGPLRIRDLSPISMLRLDFVPAHACSDDESLSVFRIDHSEANVFIVSDAAASYLEQRHSSSPLTASDIDRMMAKPGDFFIFDAELAITDFEYIRALSERTQVRVEWPVISRGGSFLDDTIQSFHSQVGLNSADRDLIARNDVNIAARINGASVVLLGRATQTTSGDPTVSVSHSFPLPRNVDVIVEGAVKIALGGERGFFSSGASDTGIQLSAEKRLRRNALYASLNFVRVGNGRVYRTFRLSNSPSAMLAWERGFGARSWTVMQTTWSRETLKPETHSPLDQDRIQVSGGLRHMIGPRVAATVALTENLVHFKNTPDLGVHVSIAWIISR